MFDRSYMTLLSRVDLLPFDIFFFIVVPIFSRGIIFSTAFSYFWSTILIQCFPDCFYRELLIGICLFIRVLSFRVKSIFSDNACTVIRLVPLNIILMLLELFMLLMLLFCKFSFFQQFFSISILLSLRLRDRKRQIWILIISLCENFAAVHFDSIDCFSFVKDASTDIVFIGTVQHRLYFIWSII